MLLLLRQKIYDIYDISCYEYVDKYRHSIYILFDKKQYKGIIYSVYNLIY